MPVLPIQARLNGNDRAWMAAAHGRAEASGPGMRASFQGGSCLRQEFLGQLFVRRLFLRQTCLRQTCLHEACLRAECVH